MVYSVYTTGSQKGGALIVILPLIVIAGLLSVAGGKQLWQMQKIGSLDSRRQLQGQSAEYELKRLEAALDNNLLIDWSDARVLNEITAPCNGDRVVCFSGVINLLAPYSRCRANNLGVEGESKGLHFELLNKARRADQKMEWGGATFYIASRIEFECFGVRSKHHIDTVFVSPTTHAPLFRVTTLVYDKVFEHWISLQSYFLIDRDLCDGRECLW